MGLKFRKFSSRTAELAALEHLEKFPYTCTYNGRNVVTTQAPSFLNRISSFLQVSRTAIKAWMSLNFKQNQPQTVELKVLERLHRLTMGNLL